MIIGKNVVDEIFKNANSISAIEFPAVTQKGTLISIFIFYLKVTLFLQEVKTLATSRTAYLSWVIINAILYLYNQLLLVYNNLTNSDMEYYFCSMDTSFLLRPSDVINPKQEDHL